MPNKNRRYKALIVDVDGTLVTNEYGGQISKKVKDQIIKSKGSVSFGIASGRPLERLNFIFDELGLNKPCVVNGGAQVVDPVSKEILWERPILSKDIPTITEVIDTLDAKVWIVDGTKEKLYEQGMKIKKPLTFFIPKILKEQAEQIISFLSAVPTLALTKVVAYHEGYVALHITHAEATKKHGVNKLAELMEIKQMDIIGVGDGYNDFSLFKACGLKIAIGNAVQGLKERADYIAPSVSDDGIADVIEKFILN